MSKHASDNVASLDTSGYLDFADVPGAWRWMKETARNDPEGFLWLSLGQARDLARVLGPARWSFGGNAMHEWTHGWVVLANGRTFMILTGARSTRYLIQGSDPEDMAQAQACITFLGDLLKSLIGEAA